MELVLKKLYPKSSILFIFLQFLQVLMDIMFQKSYGKALFHFLELGTFPQLFWDMRSMNTCNNLEKT